MTSATLFNARSFRGLGPTRLSHSSAARQLRQPPLAFAFDIDGVLVRGETPLPAAKRALQLLNGGNQFGMRIPYILLTNGGGVSESHRCQKLSAQLGIQIEVDQYIQAHTILKDLASKYQNSPVLVLGGKRNEVRQVAEEYGLKNVYTTIDVMKWNPSVWPFHTLSDQEKDEAKSVNFSRVPIQAVLVFHDPRNWALDIQILLDVIQSNGIIGGPYNHNPAGSPTVEIVFCNPDLLWRSDFERPRLGQGAFREAFQAVYKALHGQNYPYVQFGKPTKLTYDFAKKRLLERFSHMYGPPAAPVNVYMIGDNPHSGTVFSSVIEGMQGAFMSLPTDIAGANSAAWHSVLVRTGVYDPNHGPPPHKPTHEAADVEEAVKWAINEQYSP